MKKFAVILAATLALSACHHGKDEAAASVERNKEYKDKVADQGPEINPDYVKGGDTAAPAADTAKIEAAPAPVEAPTAH